MLIPCVRCGKLIESPNAANAKYIMNPDDKKTWGNDIVARFRCINRKTGDISDPRKHFDEAIAEMNARRRVYDIQIETLGPQTLEETKAILLNIGVERDAEAIEEITVKEERPKTAIVCLGCVKPDDTIIW